MTLGAQLPKIPKPVRLPNGVRVLCVPTGSGPAAAGFERGARAALGVGACAVQVWIAGGTASERAAEHGAAHFTEHMVFRPWGEDEGQDLATGIESHGGEINAYTAHDETVYYASVGVKHVLRTLDTLRRAVFEPSFDREAFVREREVILEEVGQYADDAASVIADHNSAALYPTHPYGRQILGTVAELGALSSQALAAFHRRIYVGSRVTLVVVGPVQRATVLRWARKHLGSLPKGRPAPTPKGAPRAPARGVEVLAVPGADTQIRMAWSGPGVAAPDAVALDLLSVVFGQGDAGRMAEALRREQGVAIDAHAAFVAGAGSGSFVMVATAAPDKSMDCARAMLELRAQLAANPITKREVDDARSMLQTSLVYRRETAAGQAHALGYYETISDSSGLERRYFDTLRSLTAADIARVAKRYLPLSKAQLTLGLPAVGGKRARTAAQRKALARKLCAYLDTLASPETQGAGRSHTWRRSEGLWRCEVAGGLRLVVLPDARLPIAAACLAWPGGQRAEPLAKAGYGQLLARTVTRGDEARTALGTARWLDTRAAGLDGFFGRSASGLSFESTTPDFSDLLEMALRAGAAPRLDELDVRREREATLEELGAEAQDGAAASVSQALRALYGQEHAYARPIRGVAKVVRKASPDALRGHWREHDLRHAVLGVVGEVDPDRLRRQLEQLAALWPSDQRRPAKLGAAARGPAQPSSSMLRRRGRRVQLTQSHIALAFRAVPEGHPDAAALEVAAEILGSQTGPLFAALREREGLVYGVGVGLTTGLDLGHILVHAAASGENFARTRVVLLETLKQFARTGPGAPAFERGRGTLLGHLERAWQRRASVAAALTIQTVRSGKPQAAWQWSRKVAKVSLRDVERVSATYLSAPAVLSEIRPA